MMTGPRPEEPAEAHHPMFHVERSSDTHAVAPTITSAGRSGRLVDEHQPAQPLPRVVGLAKPRRAGELRLPRAA